MAKPQCYFSQNNIKHIDYKDIELLKKFLNPHGRIQLSLAVKYARFMGLLPYVAR